MKKLKLQNALLALCLALATTLKMSNEINAMKTQQAPNSQNPNNTVHTQQIDTNNAFTFQFWKYIQDRIQGRNKDTALTQDEYANFLQKYIKDDISKFIAVKILTTHKHIKPTNNTQIANLIDETTLHTALTTDIQNPTVAKFRQLHNEIYEKIDAYGKDTRTNAEKILLLLCAPDLADAQDTNQALEQISDLIDKYNKEPINIADCDNKTLQIVLSALDSIAQLIRSDYQYQQQNGAQATELGELANLVQDFSDAYRRKPSAYTQDINIALVEQNVDLSKIDQLTDKQAQHLLQRHIKNEIPKYLALMLLANFNEIPLRFENNNENFILTNQQIYPLLFDNPPQDLNIINDKKIKAQMDNIIQELRDISSKDGEKTPEEEIISLLFNKHPEYTYKGDIINQLQAKITEYTAKKENPVDKNHSKLIGFLEKVADPIILQSELEHPCDKKTTQYKLANAVRDFSKAYQDKLQQHNQDRKAKKETLAGLITKQEDKKHQNTKKVNFAKLKNKTKTIQQTESQQTDPPTSNNSQQQPQQLTQKQIQPTQTSHNKPNSGNPPQPIKLADTYYKSMALFKSSKPKQQPLNDQDYKEFLQLYIGEDIIRYLSLLILSNTSLLTYTDLLTHQGKLPEQEFHELNQITKHLLKYTIPGDAPSKQPQTNEATTNNDNRIQFLNMQRAIDGIQKLSVFPNYSPPIELILTLLFSDKGSYNTTDDNLSELDRLTNQNYTDIDKFCDEPYPTLISYLEPVAKQLNKEHSEPNANDANNYLGRLAQILIKFSQEYIKQLKNKVAIKSSKSQSISDKKDEEDNGNVTNDNKQEEKERLKKEKEEEEKERLKQEEETDLSNSKTAQKTIKHGLAGKILANLTNTTENLSKIIKTLLP